MLASFIIMVRETLEVALIIGIVVGFIERANQHQFTKVVYQALAGGLATSGAVAWLFVYWFGGFVGRAEQMFEGATLLVGALLLTSMIVWVGRSSWRAKLEQKTAARLERAEKLGLFFFVFTAVLREGVETAIFLMAAHTARAYTLIGALLGVAAALGLGYLMFVSAKKIKLKHFFTVTSLLLMIFAAGLMARAVGEFSEAGILPSTRTLWVFGSAESSEQNWAIQTIVGLVGPITSPTALQAVVWLGYLVGTERLFKKFTPRLPPESVTVA